MKTSSNETRFLVPGVLVLFAGLAVLAVFLLIGESRRAGILVEYEADRLASSILDSLRFAGSLDTGALDSRVRGFALYDSTGRALARQGNAPELSDVAEARSGFSYDSPHRLLTLVRVLGMGGPGMRGMMGPRGGGMPGLSQRPGSGRGPGPGQEPGPGQGPGPLGLFHSPIVLYFSMDITSYYRQQFLYRAAALLAPLTVAGIAALFLSFLAASIGQRRRAEERETLARLGESARTLAHEIRNPLGAIRIQTGLLRKRIPASDSSPLNAIDEEVERLSILTRRVADFMKNPRGIPQRILVQDFLRELSGKLPAPFVFTTGTEQSQMKMRFDPELLRSVVENLVRNGRESYDEGSGDQRVEVDLSQEKGRVVISVLDRGRGIPPDLSEKVFDPFFTDKVHGSGVGLSLSRRFVEAAGGTLTLLPRRG
ncbi:MAG TPA: ATP-binding protein, partial [Spirochaetia bacterium]|nr:ATP-binding protein [Spirochaetia bacterium]